MLLTANNNHQSVESVFFRAIFEKQAEDSTKQVSTNIQTKRMNELWKDWFSQRWASNHGQFAQVVTTEEKNHYTTPFILITIIQLCVPSVILIMSISFNITTYFIVLYK